MAPSTDSLSVQAQSKSPTAGTAKKATRKKRSAATDTLYILRHVDRQLLKVGVTGNIGRRAEKFLANGWTVEGFWRFGSAAEALALEARVVQAWSPCDQPDGSDSVTRDGHTEMVSYSVAGEGIGIPFIERVIAEWDMTVFSTRKGSRDKASAFLDSLSFDEWSDFEWEALSPSQISDLGYFHRQSVCIWFECYYASQRKHGKTRGWHETAVWSLDEFARRYADGRVRGAALIARTRTRHRPKSGKLTCDLGGALDTDCSLSDAVGILDAAKASNPGPASWQFAEA